MPVVSKVDNPSYSISAAANTLYTIADLQRTVSSSTLNTTKSSNFLVIEVNYVDYTTNGTLKAILPVSVAVAGGDMYFVPAGIFVENEFGIQTFSEKNLYEHLQAPDDIDYFDYFKIIIGILGARLQVFVNTPNYNGELLATVKHIIYE